MISVRSSLQLIPLVATVSAVVACETVC